MRARAIVAATAVSLALVMAQPGPSALADGVGDLPPVTDAQLGESVSDIELLVSNIDLEASIRDVERTRTEGKETVVTLTSDILFAFGKADLPPAATAKITSLVAKVPQGGKLSVGGHTDSVGTAASNVALSQKRAAAVAAVIAKARPDTRLSVKGFGETKPIAANESGGKDNPEGRAQNRRVELRYQG